MQVTCASEYNLMLTDNYYANFKEATIVFVSNNNRLEWTVETTINFLL